MGRGDWASLDDHLSETTEGLARRAGTHRGDKNLNVDDIKDDVIPDDFSERDMLDWIFKRQHELMMRYRVIEAKNGLLYTEDCPININDRYGQARIKDFFWRTTEELTEAMDALREHSEVPVHFVEELADALHFLVEAYLLAGMKSHHIVTIQEDVTGHDWDSSTDKLEYFFKRIYGWRGVHQVTSREIYEVIHHIGCASNCLKQRPWKQTHQLTDVPKFRQHLTGAFGALMICFYMSGLNARQVFEIYFKKSEVNKFRQRSGY